MAVQRIQDKLFLHKRRPLLAMTEYVSFSFLKSGGLIPWNVAQGSDGY